MNSDFIPPLVVILMPILLIAGAIKIVPEISFPGKLGSIEQLREDVRCVDLSSSEDVMGQVVQVNRDIRELQIQNDIPFIGFFIPDRWEDVELISVRTQTCTIS